MKAILYVHPSRTLGGYIWLLSLESIEVIHNGLSYKTTKTAKRAGMRWAKRLGIEVSSCDELKVFP